MGGGLTRYQARKDAAGGGAEELAVEESNAGNWTEEEQEALDAALRQFPASMEKKERWKGISEVSSPSTAG